ncbi:MAG: hypothetical protein ABSC16_12630 [Candidatus Dormibacteria bacterium]
MQRCRRRPRDGSFTYTSAAGYSGVDTFAYTAANQYGAVGTGTVTITVEGKAATTAPTPETGAAAGPGCWTGLLPGLPLVLLGAVTLIEVRRRRRPSLPEN